MPLSNTPLPNHPFRMSVFMRTTSNLVGIVILGTLLGLGAYTKLTGKKPVPVAFDIQEATAVNRPADNRANLTTDQAENDTAPRFQASQPEELKRQPLPQQQPPLKVVAVKMVTSPSTPELPKTVPLEKPEEDIAFLVEATQVVPPTESQAASDPDPINLSINQDSTASTPKKKRKFLGIFPIKNRE